LGAKPIRNKADIFESGSSKQLVFITHTKMKATVCFTDTLRIYDATSYEMLLRILETVKNNCFQIENCHMYSTLKPKLMWNQLSLIE